MSDNSNQSELNVATTSCIPGNEDLYLFGEGTHENVWKFLGAHCCVENGKTGTRFMVWAPNASSISVVGDFNQWSNGDVMQPVASSGIWETFVAGATIGACYKFEILNSQGERLPLKADPCARHMQEAGKTASIIATDERFHWQDDSWMSRRGPLIERSAPMTIYEVHLGSWRRTADNAYLSYRDLATQLVNYVVEMNFTHLQLMPVSEYPFDGSWGYQPVGMFAPTSRFGTPDDYRFFINACHEAGIGVLQDWVPAHFPTDPHGLGRFDGSALYEHEDPRRGFHQDWNTFIYNYGRKEVVSFLLSNALYWLDEFHIDGLRVDAVASMLYLDYSREDGEWIPNEHGGNENLEAVALLKLLNERLYANHPDMATFAEESTAWPGVSRPTHSGGLGFGYKWNMGWMNDTLRYMSKDPVHRQHHHNDLTFGLSYAFSENFVLPLSHDEVVHGKGSLLGKMPGDDWQRFANLRAYYGFMWTHPGKKLLFMGGEFAQQAEWDHDRGLDWHHLEQTSHRGIQSLVKDLNAVYRDIPALHELDCEASGFEWIAETDSQNSILAYLRRGKNSNNVALVVCNFTPVHRENYRLGVPLPGTYLERINTDRECYGGTGSGDPAPIAAQNIAAHGRPHSIGLTLPPLATLVFEGPRQ